MKDAVLALLILLLGLASGIAGVACAAADAVPSSAEEAKALPMGARIPDATLRSIDGRSVRLSEIAGKKPLVLIFYRGGW